MNSQTINTKSFAVGLFGYGKFGKLAAYHLGKHFKVLVHHPTASAREKLPKNCRHAAQKETAGCDVIILAVNFGQLETLLKQIRPHLKAGSLVIDVLSVKVKPVQLMKRYLPKNSQILATHPLFGPESAAGKTLTGHKIIVHAVRMNNFGAVKKFLRSSLGLEVIEMMPAEHDKKMALVHGLTFFIARGLLKMDLPKFGLDAPSYKKLLGLAELEKHHSRELFKTIEGGNPYAARVRKKFIRYLNELHGQTLNGG